MLGEPVGKQDQYVAAHGGICSYTFHQDGTVTVEPLELETETLRRFRDNLLLFYSGEARTAASVLTDKDERSKHGDKEMIDNLHRTKDMGYQSRDLLRDGNLDDYGELMHEHWENKRKRSPGIANERVDRLYATARANDAIGGKLIGAGGGGFLLVYSRNPEITGQALAVEGAFELVFDFEYGGAQASEYL